MKIKSLILIFCVASLAFACAPNPKQANAPKSPLPEETKQIPVPNNEKFSSIDSISMFLWPEEKDIPAIRAAAEKEIEKLKDSSDRPEDQKKIKELSRIAHFENLGEIQKYIGEHATRLDDLYLSSYMKIYHAKREKILKEMEEIENNLDPSDIKKKQAEILEKILPGLTCWYKKENPKGPCFLEKLIKEEDKNVKYVKISEAPKSCEELSGMPWNFSEAKINSLCLNLSSEKKIKDDLLKEPLAPYKEKMADLKKEKSDTLDGDAKFEMDLISRAIDPKVVSAEPRMNFFETDNIASKFNPNFNKLNESNIRISIKNNQSFSSIEEGKDYVSFENVSSKIKTDVKNGTHNLKFQLDSLTKNNTKVGNVHFDVDLKSYLFDHHLIMAGKVKFIDHYGQKRNGILKIVLLEKDA